MRPKCVALFVFSGVWVLAGCAAPYELGRAALRERRYDEAVGYFAQVLARDPSQLDALAGLGISRYKLGAFGGALEALERVVSQAPAHAEARLYLALSHLRKGEDTLAEEHLTQLAYLEREPRIAVQIDRALQLIRSAPVSDELRDFIAASLEDELEWAREVREARLALRACELRYPPPFFRVPLDRHHAHVLHH